MFKLHICFVGVGYFSCGDLPFLARAIVGLVNRFPQHFDISTGYFHRFTSGGECKFRSTNRCLRPVL